MHAHVPETVTKEQKQQVEILGQRENFATSKYETRYQASGRNDYPPGGAAQRLQLTELQRLQRYKHLC